MYGARTRNGFVPASRREVFSELKHLVTPACPFVNLPETRRSRFGEELNAEKIKKGVWLRPEAVAQIEFLEWTEADRLRHSKFVGLREDKNPRSVVKEHASEAWISNITLRRKRWKDAVRSASYTPPKWIPRFSFCAHRAMRIRLSKPRMERGFFTICWARRSSSRNEATSSGS